MNLGPENKRYAGKRAILHYSIKKGRQIRNFATENIEKNAVRKE